MKSNYFQFVTGIVHIQRFASGTLLQFRLLQNSKDLLKKYASEYLKNYSNVVCNSYMHIIYKTDIFIFQLKRDIVIIEPKPVKVHYLTDFSIKT